MPKVLAQPFALSPSKGERDQAPKPTKEKRNSVMSSTPARANYSHRARPHVEQATTEAHRIPGTISPTRPMPLTAPKLPRSRTIAGLTQ